MSDNKLKCEQCGKGADFLEDEIALPGIDVNELKHVCSDCNDKNRKKVADAKDPLSAPGEGAINK